MVPAPLLTPLRARLVRRLTPQALAGLAILLTSSALGHGLIADDYFQRAVLLGRGALGSNLDPTRDLFSFVPVHLRSTLFDLGLVPWWSDPEVKIALGRPLTALTHRLDNAVWPDAFYLQHLHSLLWFGLGVGLVAALYRQVHGATSTAVLAGLLFAVEDAHAFPAAWLANRNSLLCLAIGTVVIALHVAWHRHRKPALLVAALAALAVALACGEAALGAVAYVVAWQLTDSEKPWRARVAPLFAYGGVVLLWRVLYQQAGYGTSGSRLYLDPASSPGPFAAAVVERWPLLVAGQWLQAPVDLWLILTRSQQLWFSGVSAVASLGLLAMLWPLLRQDRLARFWLLGMAFSMVPVCAAFPMDRLLVFAGLGAFGALALLAEGSSRGWRARAAIGLVALHLPVAALLLVARTATIPRLDEFTSFAERQAPAEVGVTGQTLVFVTGNDFPVFYTWAIRAARGDRPVPGRLAQLSSMMTANWVSREDERTLLISPEGGFLGLAIDQILASPTRTFTPGQQVKRADFVAEVRSVSPDGRPRQVAFRFDLPLEDARYRWLRVDSDRGLVAFPLPAVGGSVVLGAVSFRR